MAEEKQQQSVYEVLSQQDVIGLLKSVKESLYMQDNGLLKVGLQVGVTVNTPWVHYKGAMDQHCFLWHDIMFNKVNPSLPSHLQFIPSGCQQCWKCVARPKTVVQLFLIKELQEWLQIPAKCGWEPREYIDALYGAYWYARSFEQGRENYRRVRRAIDEWPGLGPDIPLVFKRACTEMERAGGDTKYWQIKPGQMQIEHLVKTHLDVPDGKVNEQPPYVKAHIMREWIRAAARSGDKTYLELTNGSKLDMAVPRTYDHLVDATQEEVDAFWNDDNT